MEKNPPLPEPPGFKLGFQSCVLTLLEISGRSPIVHEGEEAAAPWSRLRRTTELHWASHGRAS